jgi:hypothetical protein
MFKECFTQVLISVLLCMVVLVHSAEGQAIDALKTKFNDHRKKNLQEKIYLHTDRDFYVTGESVWFKAYYVDGSLHQPLNLSKILYVELLDNNNISVAQTKVHLENGSGAGSIFLPASMNSAKYALRAYTRWMKNFSPEFFFHKEVSVVNPFVKPEPGRVTRADKKNVEFFPEGGYLVRGLTSKIAVRITDSNGKGIAAKGGVISSTGDTLSRIQTPASGLGHFYFTPGTDSLHKVALSFNGGQKGEFRLPSARSTGYVMTVSDSSESILKVVARYSSRNSAGSGMYLFVHSRQVVTNALSWSGNEAIFTIPKSDLRDGISHITLFDWQLRPVCERLYFKAPTNTLAVTATTDQKQYGVRRKVKLLVETAILQKAGDADLSLAIYKSDSLTNGNGSDILSYMILESDLAGFKGNLSELMNSGTSVDDVMLSYGWRRFKWNDVLNNKTDTPFAPEYRGHLITGQIKQPDGSPATSILTYLSSPDKVVRIYPSISNAEGKVKFEAKQFPGSRRIIVQTATDSLYKIEIDNPFASAFASFTPGNLQLSEEMENELVARTIGMQVQDIFVENSRERFVPKAIDSLGFYGRPDESFLLDQYTRFPVMEEVMREYVPGVLVRKRRDGFHFLVLDKVHKAAMKEDPLIMLDGVPIVDTDDIMAFDPRKVRKLEVVTRPYYLAHVSFPGIVSYTTYNGDLAGFQFDAQTVQLDYEGLQVQREFYKPVYENQSQRSERTPDMRNLLYWNPNVKTGSSGKAEIEFFTSDIEGPYIIRIEGMSKTGAPGSVTTTFVVKSFEN